MRAGIARILPLVGVFLFGSPAMAQQQAAQAQSGAGGVPAGGGIRHLSSTGVGMAVGRSANANGTVVSYEGFLARYVAARDTVPPVFDPPPQNIRAVIPANAAACSMTVAIPAARAVDNRDPNPVVTVVLNTNPAQNINPAGQNVVLARGTYDVLLTATDRRGNRAQATYRIDVVDTTPPVIANVPNPTPAGQEAEATSPAGTPVAFNNPTCTDVCDAAPALTNNAPARYPLGDTNVTFTCRDASANQSQAQATIRVRDRTAPTVAGGAPAAFQAECNNPAGSTVQVPGIAWTDNGFNANQLTQSLIVDPAGANQAYNPMPAQIVLTGGAHVLRYVAVDPSGNRGTYDLQVTVIDQTAPTITVVNAPALGWYNQDANVQLRITDNCSAQANALQVNIQPPPAAQAVNGELRTLTYRADGIYSLNIVVTDGAGNSVNDNSVGFGIDRTAPVASVTIPSQTGVVAGQTYTFPLYAMAENMPLNVNGDDPGDGGASGVRRIQVLLDPDAQGRPTRTLTDRTFPGQGNPQRGARTQNNIRCTDNVAGDAAAKCNAGGEVMMRELPVGPHVLRTIVTDFAGNTHQVDARVVDANLYSGLDIVATRIQARLAAQPPLPANVAGPLNLALPKLNRGRIVAAMGMPESPYGTPVFLGGALKAVQDATTNLDQAITNAPAGERPTLVALTSALQRIGRSDLVLFSEVIEDAGVIDDILRDVELSQWLAAEYATDMGNASDWMTNMEASIAAERWTNAAAAGVEAFFALKSAWTSWMMDYHYQPADQFPGEQFARGADILSQIEDELTTYLTIQNAPAAQKARDMRDQLATTSASLARLAVNGFDNANGLSDQAYLGEVLALQTLANSSMQANDQGMWVRNYQWSMMQVVRLMAQSSTALARLRQGAVARNWPLFTFAQSRIDTGVAFLEDRRVQEAITLYGEPVSTCSIIGVYHCHFLTDETVGAVMDTDQPYTQQLADYCWQNTLLYNPAQWNAAPAGATPARCRWDQEVP